MGSKFFFASPPLHHEMFEQEKIAMARGRLRLKKVGDFSFFHMNYVNVQKRMKQNGKISLNDNENNYFDNLFWIWMPPSYYWAVSTDSVTEDMQE